jgi:hypothetical protein
MNLLGRSWYGISSPLIAFLPASACDQSTLAAE